MKNYYGVYGACLLLLIVVAPVSISAITPVTWGNLDGNSEFYWHLEKYTHDFSPRLPNPNGGYLQLKIPSVGMPDEFNLSQPNTLFTYSTEDSDTAGTIDPDIDYASELSLLILPMVINGTPLLNYLLTETSTLGNITNSNVLGISQQNQHIVMTSSAVSNNQILEVKFTWSLSSGLLLEKHVLGDKGGEILWTTGKPPYVYEWWWLIILVPLFLMTLLSYYYLFKQKKNAKPVEDPDARPSLRLTVAVMLTLAFLYLLLVSLTFDGFI